MKIAIDITSTVNAHAIRGVGIYTKFLIKSLEKFKNKHLYYLFTRGQKIPKDIELIHYPYFDPFFLTLPIFTKIPYIITVHDLIPLVFPDKFNPGIRGKIKWQLQKLCMSKSRRIICDSNTSKKDISRITRYPDDRIDVVYLAPTVNNSEESNNQVNILKNYNISKPYLFYLGDINWNKNIPNLIRAYGHVLKLTEYKDLQLVLGGGAFKDDNLSQVRYLNLIIHQLGIQKRVIKTGFIKDDDLNSVYLNSQCFVFPSYYEGFGLPPLNAMSLGVPTIVADISSLAEIKGPAYTFNPQDYRSIATALSKILRMGSDKRLIYGRKLKNWAQEFSWQKVAQQTIQSYEKALV